MIICRSCLSTHAPELRFTFKTYGECSKCRQTFMKIMEVPDSYIRQLKADEKGMQIPAGGTLDMEGIEI